MLLITDEFAEILPKLTDLEKEKLLAFGEEMAFKAEQQEKEKPA